VDINKVLYHKGKGGTLYSWRVWVEGDMIMTEHGLVDGKKMIASKRAKPKNVGRSNATTPEVQAEIEAKAQWVHKRERKYSETPEAAEQELFLPMLAPTDKWEKAKKKIKYPAICQPKLDGNRSLSHLEDDGAVMRSRQGKVHGNLPHINAELSAVLPEGMVVDGELYCHGVTLQTINSWVKKNRPESMQIRYHLYDLPEQPGFENVIQKDRTAALEKFFAENLADAKYICLVESVIVNSDEEVMALHDKWVAEGYEGAIVRNMDAIYDYGHRSANLAKVKVFDDAEFKVIGFSNGEGLYEDCVKWRCVTKDGVEFDVNPKGTLEQKREWLRDGQEYIGSMLTVRYMGFTEKGIPKIAVGVVFREEGDLPSAEEAA
jgi:DNA ligase-1